MAFRTEIRREEDEFWYRLQHHPDLTISPRLNVRYIRDGSPHPLRFETEPGAIYSLIHWSNIDSFTRDWLFVRHDESDKIVAFSMRTGKRLCSVMAGDTVNPRVQIAAVDERRLDSRRVQVRALVTDGFVPPLHPDGTVYLPEGYLGEGPGYAADSVRLITINIDTETEEAEVLPPQLITGEHDPNNLLTAGRRVLRFSEGLGLPDCFIPYRGMRWCFTPDGRFFAIEDYGICDVKVSDTVNRALLFTVESVHGFGFLTPTLIGVSGCNIEEAEFMILSVPLGGRVVRDETLGMYAISLMPDNRDDDGSGEQFRYVIAEGIRTLDGEDFDVFHRFDRAALMNELPNGGGD